MELSGRKVQEAHPKRAQAWGPDGDVPSARSGRLRLGSSQGQLLSFEGFVGVFESDDRKVISEQSVDVDDLDKDKAYKLNIVFKAYDFVAKGETRKGYVVSLIDEYVEKPKDN